MEWNFAGKRAVVTGAGSGMGRDIAKTLSAAGATVYGVSLLQTELDTLTKECPGIRAICVDVSNWEVCQSAISEIGPVDMLVNCAGVLDATPFFETTEEIFNKVIDVNLKGTLIVAQAVARSMVEHKIKGSIVNISSTASDRAGSTGISYSASKAAVAQMTRYMASELGPQQIRVNAVQPGFVASTQIGQEYVALIGEELLTKYPEMTAMKRHIEVPHVTSAVLFLLSDKSDMITGSILPVEGGRLCT